MNVLVVGAGGLASFVASRLLHAGVGVSIIGNSERVSEIGRHGIVINDRDFNSRHLIRTRRFSQIEPVDLVVLATRAHVASFALAAASPAITDKTLILPLAFDLIRLETLVEDGTGIPLGAVAEVDIAMRPDGTVRQTSERPVLRLGGLTCASGVALEQLSRVFDDAGFEVKRSSDIRAHIFCRFMFSAIGAAFLKIVSADAAERLSFARRKSLLSDLLYEASRVAASLHLRLDESQVREYRNRFQRHSSCLPNAFGSPSSNAVTEAQHDLMVMVRHSQDTAVNAPTFMRAYYGAYPPSYGRAA
ncbi:MAG: 2-dehydropantoate 2-reductase N-terminal domain-containing protein [Hyphomicrobium sp.]|uniref:ketopantoate reductase family protein n=1 Tax=Hyphomicrobium sp. TaxID=82 RepID=UPI00356367FC